MAVCGKCIHKNVCEFCKEMGFQNVVRANDFNCKDYLPEADVVEVVRCRNCANFKEIMNERQIKFILPLPIKEEFNKTPTGRARTEKSQYEAWEQACRQRWRALNLVIKAKLEAVECGISVFDDEFMSNIVLPGGQTVSDFMKPQIEQAYICGTIPKMLPMLEEAKGDT